MGFTKATEIQAQAIPALLKQQDFIGQAGTGTGKTAAFAIPTIELLDYQSKDIQALILCPTRELAVQVAEQFKLLTKYQRKLSCVAIYGGQSINAQFQALQRGAQIVVGTPGRVMDHMRRGTLRFDNLKMLVLDEADRMLDMGFQEDIETILKATPSNRQTVLFSATMAREILKLAQNYQKNPLHIDITAGKQQSAQITQLYFDIKRSSKNQALKRLLAFYKVRSALVFCNTKQKVDELARMLKQDGFATGALHGDIRQNKRNAVMKRFREDSVRLLIATDVAARGIDVNDVDAVINYDIPRDDQDYVHRIGRTGRAGKTGLALSFVVGSERQHIKYIARNNDMAVKQANIPSIKELGLDTVLEWQNLFTNSTLSAESAKEYLKLIKDKAAAEITKIILNEKASIIGIDVDFSAEHGGEGSSRSKSKPRQSHHKAKPEARSSGGHKSSSGRGRQSGSGRGKPASSGRSKQSSSGRGRQSGSGKQGFKKSSRR